MVSIPIIPATLRRLREEDHRFKASLGYRVSSRSVGKLSKTLVSKFKKKS
jgi:hypothetical protein